jgi:nucleotide-binding universal stress UspA family protein
MKEHVLVPLAGMPEFETVLPHLRTLVRRGASDLTLLRTELPASVEGFELLRDAALAHARAFLVQVKRRLSRLKVRVHLVTAIGAPADTILEVARDRKVTLILLSSARRTSLARFLFGSVPEQVVRRSPVPVVVIPSEPSSDRETVGAGSRRSAF